MRKYHLLYDVNFSLAYSESEISLQELTQLIPEINRNILGHFNFDFHSGLAGCVLDDKVACAFPYVDVFNGKVYLVMEMTLTHSADLSDEDMAILSEFFDNYEKWRCLSVTCNGEPIFMDVEFENAYLELSQTYGHSLHYKFIDLMSTPVSPMAIESNRLMREFFYQLKNSYPEIDVKQSTYIYEATRNALSFKMSRVTDIVEDRKEELIESGYDLRHCLQILVRMHEIYKSLAQWSSKEIYDNENISATLSKLVGIEDVTSLSQQYNKMRQEVLSLGKQLQHLFNKMEDVPGLPDELKDCFKSFIC